MAKETKDEKKDAIGTPEVDAFDIFNTNVEDMTSYEETESYEKKDYSKIFFEPDPKAAGKTLTYIVKLLPNIYAPKNPAPKRYTYKIPVPTRPDKNFTWVSPSSVGKSCPVMDAYFRFKDSPDARLQAIAKNLVRKRYRCVVVEIISAPSEPELVGQFRLFKFAEGREIDNMIKQRMNPSEEDRAVGIEGVNVFDPFSSPLLVLRVSQGEYGRDFTASEWAPEARNQGVMLYEYDENGQAIDPKNKQRKLTDADRGDAEMQKKIIELLKADNINMQEHWMFKDPDDDYLKKVKDSIELMETGKISGISSGEAEETSDKKEDDSTERLDAPVEAKTEPTSAATPETKAASNAAKEKALDDLFNDNQ